MGQGAFWKDVPGELKRAPSSTEPIEAAPRCLPADRSQICLRPLDLDGLIPEDHRARLVWRAVEGMDLSGFYKPIKARENRPGRPSTDPKVLLALWLYATSQGEGSAREIERLTKEHRAYRWLRGEVPLNYHMLSDFRWQRAAAIDDLLTQLLGVLMHQGLITLMRVAQDGLRVRASAGGASFRRRKKLKECMALARKQVEELKSETPDQANKRSKAQHAAQQRAAEQREQRVKQALQELQEIEANREKAKKAGNWVSKKEPRASTTDPQARTMKMPDGGFRPAYNAQLASEGGFIVAVDVTNDGTDYAHAVPMMKQIERRTGKIPKQSLFDAGYSSKQTINQLSELGITVFAAGQKHGNQDPYAVRKNDPPAVNEWRERMTTPEGKETYKKRAEHERFNAVVRVQQTLDRLSVRGQKKVLAVAVLNVLAFDLMQWIRLGMGS